MSVRLSTIDHLGISVDADGSTIMAKPIRITSNFEISKNEKLIRLEPSDDGTSLALKRFAVSGGSNVEQERPTADFTRVIVDNGSATDPSYTFSNSPATGLYMVDDSNLQIALNAENRLKFDVNTTIRSKKHFNFQQISSEGAYTEVMSYDSNGYLDVQGYSIGGSEYQLVVTSNAFINGYVKSTNGFRVESDYGNIWLQSNVSGIYTRNTSNAGFISWGAAESTFEFAGGNTGRLSIKADGDIITERNIRAANGTFDNPSITFTERPDVGFYTHGNYKMRCVASNAVVFQAGIPYVGSTGAIWPSGNNSGSLGLGTYEWASLYVNTIYATNTTIQASDDRIKTDETIIEGAMDTLNKLRPQIYTKWDSIDDAATATASSSNDLSTLSSRTESGLIAQEMFYDAPELRHIIALPSDADSNALYTSTITSSTDPSIDPAYPGWGSEVAGVKYTELIPYIIKALQEKDAQLVAQAAAIADLQARV